MGSFTFDMVFFVLLKLNVIYPDVSVPKSNTLLLIDIKNDLNTNMRYIYLYLKSFEVEVNDV